VLCMLRMAFRSMLRDAARSRSWNLPADAHVKRRGGSILRVPANMVPADDHFLANGQTQQLALRCRQQQARHDCMPQIYFKRQVLLTKLVHHQISAKNITTQGRSNVSIVTSAFALHSLQKRSCSTKQISVHRTVLFGSMLRRPLVRASVIHAIFQRARIVPSPCSSLVHRFPMKQPAHPAHTMAFGGKPVRSQVASYPHPFRGVASASATGNGANGAGERNGRLSTVADHSLRRSPATPAAHEASQHACACA